jgi:Flp pilus assembly protein TadB
MGREMAEAEGVQIGTVIVDDDVAVKDSTYTVGRRGVAGNFFVIKALGAAAEQGADLEALVALGERVGSKNLTFVINAVTIQRQIGGALAGLFDMVADTVRQRQQFMRKVKGLTAMGRMTAYVLTGLPFGIGLLITVMNPTYMSPLFNTHTGQMVLASGAVMLLIGTGILRKMVQFKG